MAVVVPVPMTEVFLIGGGCTAGFVYTFLCYGLGVWMGFDV